ncbi:MAG: ATP-dependent DNA helicase RecG [Hyphomicrobiaceae bacterium]|nr:ATP-dependent DNA helicase RecG [Hyphomicrobiaceae bacterium]
MRPENLAQLFLSAQTLNGVGPRLSTLLKKVIALPSGINEARIIDLLLHLPTGVIDRRSKPSLEEVEAGNIATFQVRVSEHHRPPSGNRKAPYKVTCKDATGTIDLIFFRTEHRFVEQQLPIGEVRFISGRVEKYGTQLQMVHPDYIVTPQTKLSLPLLEPIYPLTAGLSGKVLGKIIRQSVKLLPELPEWLDDKIVASRQWPTFADAVRLLHIPKTLTDISPIAVARTRLAYDELLASQLALLLLRTHRKQPGRSISAKGILRQRLIDTLPFTLTETQKKAANEIESELASDKRMLRLLQGDVGSGKTVVALLAIATASEVGAQSALMAPTEILARQHAETISYLASEIGINIEVLTGREKGPRRKEILKRTAEGEINVLVGTHALFQPEVIFDDLALVIIDEQHRFGVQQRLALQSKGRDGGANVLAMTATPIPRTLLMTHYGDLKVSNLTEKPTGRKSIVTILVSLERLEEIVNGITRAIGKDTQVYWICPLIESSDISELSAVEERYAHLSQIFSNRVGLLHGAMLPTEKDKVMAAFSDNLFKILVSTTVIEVGINVPNASIMVVEHAERFGLAQLHQLRGRVGRGETQSYCILLYKAPLSNTAKARLCMMRDTEDGFLIAEKDLELRGGGDVLGARQSGMPAFRIANVPDFNDLQGFARYNADRVLLDNPDLNGPQGHALKTLLYLFEFDEAVKLFNSA